MGQEKLGPEQKPTPPFNFVPKVGEDITIQRKDGTIESGWRIFSLDSKEGNLFIKKDGPDGVIEKHTKISEVERFNRTPRLYDIETSQNFNQLKYTLEQLRSISGSERNYSSDDLIERLNAVINGEASPKIITRTARLRSTVERLLQEMPERREEK